MSHTTSKTWCSDQSREYESFARARCNYSYIAPSSPIVPRTWSEWIKHRLFIQEETQSQELRRLAIKTLVNKIQETDDYQPPFADKTFEDHLSSVLARESIWLPSYTAPPGKEQAPWPTREELKQEGNGRSNSEYYRFLPLPRVPGSPTVSWRQRIPVVPFQFDKVEHFSAKEEGSVPETDETMLLLVGDYLLRELDC